jgi:hypothetical protein
MARSVYAFLAERAGHRCEYCFAPEYIFNARLHVEHIVPRRRRGTDDPDNLALACAHCNAHKAAATSAPDPETGRDVPLFSPRRDNWDDHFVVDDTFRVLGRSPIGRATVARLHMNDEEPLRARAWWVICGLFPPTPPPGSRSP